MVCLKHAMKLFDLYLALIIISVLIPITHLQPVTPASGLMQQI